jgi:hypothetical protein
LLLCICRAAGESEVLSYVRGLACDLRLAR